MTQSETLEKTSYHQDKESKKLDRQRKRKLEEIESRIEELEEQIQDYEDELCKPEVFQDHEKVLEINLKNEKAKSELEQLMEDWAEIAE
ncbi:MAG: multidrug transporter ATP-binding protein [Neobacillus sp.]|nr:multidrug transporter ATP-binding protein [Neobacillus sp.]